MWTRPNKHEDDAKPARVLNAKNVNTNGHVKKNTVRAQKDSNMLCYATAERSSNATSYIADEIIAQEQSEFTSGGKQKLCLRSRQPSRELVREERKRISEMEKLINQPIPQMSWVYCSPGVAQVP